MTYLRQLMPVLCRELESSGVRTHVVLNRDVAARLEAVLQEVPLSVLSPRWTSTPGLVRTGLQQVVLPLLYRRLQADVVLNVGDIVALCTHVPQVLLCRNILLYEPGAKSNGRLRALAWLARRSVVNAASVVFVSQTLAETVTKRLPVPRWTVVHHGPGLHVPFTERLEWPLPIRAIVVGALADYKRVELAIDAIAALRRREHSATLHLVGADAERQYASSLRAQVERLHLQDAIRFSGDAPPTAVLDAYAEATVALVTSASESFCHPILEALSSGLPVIAANDLSVAEEIGAGTQIPCLPDGEAMADEIEALFCDAERYRRHAREGRSRAAQFSWRDAGRDTAEALLACARART